MDQTNPDVAEVWAGDVDGYGYAMTVSLPAGSVVDADVPGLHNATVLAAEASIDVEPALPAEASLDYPLEGDMASAYTAMQFSFPFRVKLTGSGSIDLGGLSLRSSDAFVQDSTVYLFPSAQMTAGKSCATASTGMFVSEATNEDLIIPGFCVDVEMYTPSTTVSTDSTTTSTSASSSTSTTRFISTSTSTSTSSSMSSATSTTVSTSTSTSEIPMCESTAGTNCSGLVFVGTICQAIDCPANSAITGSTVCFQSEYMIGATYCLADGVSTEEVASVAAEFELRLLLDPDVDESGLRLAVRKALLGSLGINDQDLRQLVVKITGQTRRRLEQEDGNVTVSRSLRPAGRRLTTFNVNPVTTSVDVFYEVVAPLDDTAAATVSSLAADLTSTGTAASTTFSSSLSTVGTVDAVRGVQAPTVTQQTLGVTFLGNVLSADNDGDGVVDGSDYVSSTSTASSSSTTVSTRPVTVSTASTSTSTSPLYEAVPGGGDDDDGLMMVLIIVGASVGGCCCCCICLFCLFKVYKVRFHLEEI